MKMKTDQDLTIMSHSNGRQLKQQTDASITTPTFPNEFRYFAKNPQFQNDFMFPVAALFHKTHNFQQRLTSTEINHACMEWYASIKIELLSWISTFPPPAISWSWHAGFKKMSQSSSCGTFFAFWDGINFWFDLTKLRLRAICMQSINMYSLVLRSSTNVY